jgi:hypothetical protein
VGLDVELDQGHAPALVAEIARCSRKQRTLVQIDSCGGEANMVEAMGLEPTNLLTARLLLVVLSRCV